MRRKSWDPGAPEVIEAMVQRVRGMSREHLEERLAWRPEGAEETWRLAHNGGGPATPPDPAAAEEPRRSPAGRRRARARTQA